ncbi:MAG TPA: hypothetical protein VHS27_00180 [Gaiellales bacterium]|nr:hypothetical protein [Gaiellales bacterium]
MSPERTSGLLLRLYPARWRARYGEELKALILDASEGRVSWRLGIDVALAAVRERLRSAGMIGDLPPEERARGGILLVLAAWAPFVMAGVVVQKFSEHWQAATPPGSRTLATSAFDVLLFGAAVATALILAGVAVALPTAVRFLRSGGWREVRRHLVVAGALTVVAVPVSILMVVWAHGLSAAQRNGQDAAYETAAVVWALLLALWLVAWTVVGVALGRRLALSTRALRYVSLLAVGVALSMAAMTAATVLWWVALARSAPWFLAGEPAGSPGSSFAPALLLAAIVMVGAAGAAAAGASRALRAAPPAAPRP